MRDCATQTVRAVIFVPAGRRNDRWFPFSPSHGSGRSVLAKVHRTFAFASQNGPHPYENVRNGVPEALGGAGGIGHN